MISQPAHTTIFAVCSKSGQGQRAPPRQNQLAFGNSQGLLGDDEFLTIAPAMMLRLRKLTKNVRYIQFIRFCLVGESGVLVDMAVLYLLADSRWLHWNISLSKFCSAEAAMLNNFFWNEVWTFQGFPGGAVARFSVARRLVRFHAICGIGIGLAVLFLHLFHTWLGLNLYASNFLAILLVTLWNFWMNALFNWRANPKENS